MIQKFHNLILQTDGQKLYDFTNKTLEWIKKNNFKNGIINLSIQHTSASLIIQENADPDVQLDLLNFFDKIAPMKNNLYIHNIYQFVRDFFYQQIMFLYMNNFFQDK